MKNLTTILLAIIIPIIFSCMPPPINENGGPVTLDSPEKVKQVSDWAEQSLQKLTLREKISQMLIYSMSLTFRNNENKQWQELLQLAETDGIGGIHLWKGNTGLSVTMLNELQKNSKIPILIDMDIEKGLQQRFPEGTQMPPAMALAATGNTKNAHLAGQVVAQEGRSVGVHWNLAPVIDVNNNPENPIINTRAFSDEPEMVSEFAINYIKGLQSKGMLATAKHFPGHGDTHTDSHSALATISSYSVRLWSIELAPYRKVIEAGVDAVMISHLIAPEFQPNSGTPATLSKFWIQDILRGKLGFRGAVITDAMDMGGVTNGFSNEYALINAINAGCDIIIQNHSYINSLNIIENAVKNGLISQRRIDEAAFQMLNLKEKIGLHTKKTVEFEDMQNNLGLAESQRAANRIAQESITIVKNNKKLLPLKTSGKLPTTIIDVYGSKYFHNRSDAAKIQSKYCSNRSYFAIDENDQIDYSKSIINSIKENSVVILNVFAKPRVRKGTVALNKTQSYLVNEILKKTPNVVMISFGNPYIIQDFPNIPAYVCAWESQSYLQDAAAKIIFGVVGARGKLPIIIPKIAPRGHGLIQEKSYIAKTKPTRYKIISIKKVMPHEVGADTDKLLKLLSEAVVDSAFPGGVLLAMKNGKIFAHEAVGYHTYSKEKQTGLGNIYDLASLTKVISTTSAIMKLFDDGKIKLDDQVSKYLPEIIGNDSSNIDHRKAITIRHLLTHTAGFPPFIPIHKMNGTVNDRLNAIYNVKLLSQPGQKYIYSDIGFIMLGKIMEQITNKSIAEYVDEEIFQPLGMQNTFFLPPSKKLNRIPPTEFLEQNNNFVHGKVHDENARSLGGIAGHAGLFATAYDLAIFSQMMLNGGQYKTKNIFKNETVKLFTTIINPEMSSRCLGWDSPNDASSGGVYLSDDSFGHTGFTGTSLWIDRDNKIAVILLTNAVHPQREWKNPKYYNWRQRIHSAVYETLGFSDKNPKLKWRKNWYAD